MVTGLVLVRLIAGKEKQALQKIKETKGVSHVSAVFGRWDLVLDINLKGALHCTKAALRPILKARFGRIVNIASLVGPAGHAGQANYAASKGGLISLTKSSALELASRNIRVNAVAPGFIRTPMTDAAPEEEKTRFAAAIPLGRIGEPIDIARAVLFLCCEDSAYITGHVLNVNVGSYL